MTGWRKPLIGAGVLALHALLLAALLDTHNAPPPREDARETTLLLLPLPHPKPPEEKKLPATPAAASRAITITIPKSLSTPPNAQALPGAQGLGMALGCSASNYNSLGPAERASCKHGPWGYDAQARETASLIVKAPPPPMSAADRAWRIRSTADPCLTEKAAHLPFCIYTIIYGDKLP